jgi:hypothetical protein
VVAALRAGARRGGDAEAAIRASASQFAVREHLEPPTSPLALLRDIRRLTRIDEQPAPSKFLVEQLTRDPDSLWVACDWATGSRRAAWRSASRAHALRLDETIMPEHYKAVAQVIGYVMRLKNKVGRSGRGRSPSERESTLLCANAW